MRFGKNRQFGFSLVEVMVAMGLLGAGAVAFMQMQKSNIKSNKASEARYDVNNLASEINSVLINEDACSNTFRTILNSSSTNGTFTKIKDSSSSAQDLYTVGQEVEDSIRIAGFSYEMKTPFVDIAGQKKASFRVSFSYQYTNKAVNNPNTYQKNIEQDYTVLLDGSNVFKTCYSDTDNTIASTLETACKSIGAGTSELPTHCELTNPAWPAWWTDGVTENTGGMSFLDIQNVVIPKMKEDFLSLDGSSHMVGTLTTSYVLLGKSVDPFNLPPSDLPEYDYEKHALAKAVAEEITHYCPVSGEAGFFKSQPSCTTLLCTNANEYLAGYGDDGEPVCNKLVTESTCDSGGKIVVNPLDGSAKYECCTPTCSGAENYCVGKFFDSTNGCGLCAGTKPSTPGEESYIPTGEYRLVGTCVAGKQKREQKMKQVCVKDAPCSLDCTGPEIKWKEEAVPVSCGCDPVAITIEDIREDAVKASWIGPKNFDFKFELWDPDFGSDGIDARVVSSDDSGYAIADFQGLSPSNEYGLRVGYDCKDGGEFVWSEAVFKTKGNSCPVPEPVDIFDITETSAGVRWMDYEENLTDLPPGVEGFEVTYGHEGYDHEAGPFEMAGSKRIGLNGLTPNTRYDVYIRSICVGDERGEWSARHTFQTTGEVYLGLRWLCQEEGWINSGEECSGKTYSCEDTCSPPDTCLITTVGGSSCCKQKPTGACMAGGGLELPTTTSGGGGCFIAGSQVTMADRHQMNIEEVKVGDKLLTTSHAVNTVKKLLRIDYKGLIYSINGSEYFFTPNHPLKTLSGWKSLRPDLTRKEIPDLKVEKLKLGDILVKDNGLEAILSLDSKYTEETVYNFELDGDHEFIVNDIGVHNKLDCSCTYMSGDVLPGWPSQGGKGCKTSTSRLNSQCAGGVEYRCGNPEYEACI